MSAGGRVLDAVDLADLIRIGGYEKTFCPTQEWLSDPEVPRELLGT